MSYFTNDTPPVPFREMTIQVHRVFWDDLDALHPDDREVPDFACVFVPPHLELPVAAALALGRFHTDIPIENLSCFEISVYAGVGKQVKPSKEHCIYELVDEYPSYLD